MASGGGDRAPDYGMFDTRTRSVVVRRPGVTTISSVSDPQLDNKSSAFDLVGVSFATVVDQFFADLNFAQIVDPTNSAMPDTLEGMINIDSDRSIATGGEPFLNSVIPTWGGDTRLYFYLGNPAHGSGAVLRSSFSDVDTHSTEKVFGSENTDYRWVASGRTLSIATSLSMQDAFAVETAPSYVSRRVPTDGRMVIQTFVLDRQSYPVEFAPNSPAALDTATGRALQPFAWDNLRTVSGNDSPYDVNSPTSQHTPEWTQVDAQIVGGNLVVRGLLENLLPTTLYTDWRVWLDTDMNAATGVLLVGDKAVPIGADYVADTFVSLAYAAPVPDLRLQSVSSLHTTSLDAAVRMVWGSGYGPNAANLGSWTVTIPLKLLGQLGPQLRLYVTESDGITVLDTAPLYPIVINTGL